MKNRIAKVILYLTIGKEIDFDLGNMTKMVTHARDKKKLLRTLLFIYSQLEELGKIILVLSEDENNFENVEDISVLSFLLQNFHVEFGKDFIIFEES